jgi:hypothetical protein
MLTTLSDTDRPKSLCIWGPSRLYKTLWARSLRDKHAYIAGEWNANILDESAEYVIIDDIPLERTDMNRVYKQLLGCQKDFSVTDKYLKKV